MFRSFKIFEFLFSGANFCRSSFAQIKAQLAPNYIISIICQHLLLHGHWVPNSWMDFHRDDGFFEKKNKKKSKPYIEAKNKTKLYASKQGNGNDNNNNQKINIIYTNRNPLLPKCSLCAGLK